MSFVSSGGGIGEERGSDRTSSPGVKTAFFLCPSPPSTCARVLPCQNRSGARNTANAGIPLLVQRVVGEMVLTNVRPHVGAGPRRERIDFHQAESLIAFQHPRTEAIGRLIPPNRRDPRLETGQRRPQRKDLADFAAAVRVAVPELGPHLFRLSLDAQAWAHRADGNPVTALELFP